MMMWLSSAHRSLESWPSPDTDNILDGSTAGLLWANPPHTGCSLLTVLRIVPATAVAANVLDLFPDVTVNRKGHVVVVMRMLAVPFLVAERHYFDQAERLFLGFLHGHGRVFSAPRGKPSTVHDGGCRIHRRVIGRLEHWDAENRVVLQVRDVTTAWIYIKGPSIQSYLPYSSSFPLPRPPHLYLRSQYAQATRLRNAKVAAAAAAEKKALLPDPSELIIKYRASSERQSLPIPPRAAHCSRLWLIHD